MKESRYFSCNENGHTIYDCFRKKEVAAISKSINKKNDSQRKE